MYKLYDKYKNEKDSWWYKYFGNDEDGFSIMDFFILILAAEMSTNILLNPETQGMYSYAISERFSSLCAEFSGGSCGGVSDNAMMNYLTIRGSAWLRYDNYITWGKPIADSDPGFLQLITSKAVVENALSNITPKGSMADWGNISVNGVQAVKWDYFTGHEGIIFPPPDPPNMR